MSVSATIDAMTTPIKPLPEAVERWMSRVRALRWGDAAVAWVLVWGGLVATLGETVALAGALVATAVVAAGAWLPPLRLRWRPLSAMVGVRASRSLRPGMRAWYVHANTAQLVVVTARRRLRVVIAAAVDSRTEGFAVRRTRVLLLPADSL
jgi:hypothetical protein